MKARNPNNIKKKERTLIFITYISVDFFLLSPAPALFQELMSPYAYTPLTRPTLTHWNKCREGVGGGADIVYCEWAF